MSDTLQDAQSALQAGKVAEAARLYHDLLRTDPRHFDALSGLGLIYFHTGQFERAPYLIGEALKLDFVEALANHATTLLEMDRPEEGLAELDRALAIDPLHAISWNNRGNAMVALNRYAEAVDSYERALAINPEFPDAQRNRLYALGELNRGGPHFAEILCAQALEMMQRQRWGEALNRFDEALAAKPDF